MHTVRRSLIAAAALLATTLGAVSTAAAAAPEARTTGVTGVGPGAATLRGTVDPNGEATSYFFEYGTTRTYGSRTAEVNAGNGNSRLQVQIRIDGLAPNTTHHFRLVASNASGVRNGANRSFKTRPQPLGLHISATPNPVTFGSSSTITGTLTGTGNAGRDVVLQQRPFPFTAEFADIGSAVVTDPNGNFSFNVLPLPSNTQFRVRTATPNNVFSEILTLGVAASVTTNVSRKVVRRSRRTRISGTVAPARVGAPFEIQSQTRSGLWLTVARGFTREGNGNVSRYSKRIRVWRTTRYRVIVHMLDGQLVAGFGREVPVVARRRSRK